MCLRRVVISHHWLTRVKTHVAHEHCILVVIGGGRVGTTAAAAVVVVDRVEGVGDHCAFQRNVLHELTTNGALLGKPAVSEWVSECLWWCCSL